ncbi:hypothetical protein CERZMDRAFT_82461 [Cercospora zeae-maydis SCOH1-5]|uniref:Uncharacterized protein n=1 Tax=Cercospora zeae-maydis SCOH1-5 TaxID=717836 RepID=A0A6A6FQ84_9PEZI|nr:hypothetical protein CERZMDRAFT_82461 [Cercospora zeae-maydis SCOH1-5]
MPNEVKTGVLGHGFVSDCTSPEKPRLVKPHVFGSISFLSISSPVTVDTVTTDEKRRIQAISSTFRTTTLPVDVATRRAVATRCLGPTGSNLHSPKYYMPCCFHAYNQIAAACSQQRRENQQPGK